MFLFRAAPKRLGRVQFSYAIAAPKGPILLKKKGVRLTSNAEDRRTSWLETFSDLVFVGAVANASTLAFTRYDAADIGRFALVFVPIWWAWIGSAFYSSRFHTDDLTHRLLVMGQMAMVASMAAFTPSALGRGGNWFALAYVGFRALLVVQYLRAGHYIPKARRLVRGYTIGFSVAGAVWLASVFVPFQMRPVLWFIGIVIDLATPSFSINQALEIPPHFKHIPERFGLFTIILLGETVAATTSSISIQNLNFMAAASAFSGIVLAFAVWWDYFEGVGATAERKVYTEDHGRNFRIWMYLHLPLTALIALMAAGLKHAIFNSAKDPFTAGQATILCVVGSLTMFTLGFIWLTNPRGAARTSVARQSALYVLVSGLPLIAAPWAGYAPAPAIVGGLALVFVLRIAQGARDFKVCQARCEEDPAPALQPALE